MFVMIKNDLLCQMPLQNLCMGINVALCFKKSENFNRYRLLFLIHSRQILFDIRSSLNRSMSHVVDMIYLYYFQFFIQTNIMLTWGF